MECGQVFKVFPNPAGKLFYITSKQPGQQQGYYSILNLSGAFLLKGQLDGEGRAEISTGRLAPGIYLVQIERADYREHHKLLVLGQ